MRNSRVFFAILLTGCLHGTALRSQTTGGEKPPDPGLSPTAQKLWGLWVSDPPLYSGIQQLFEPTEAKSLDFLKTIDELEKNPVIHSMYEEGKKFFDSYIQAMKDRISKNKGRDVGAELDPYPGILKSFDDFVAAKKGSGERPYTEIEASNAARSDMLRKYAKLGITNFEDDPMLRREYATLVQRYHNLTVWLPQSPPDEAKFMKWKKGQVDHISKIIGANRKRMLILEMTEFGGADNFTLHEIAPDGSVLIDDPRAIPLTPEKLERLDVRYESVWEATKRTNHEGKTVASYVTEIGGKRYAVSTKPREWPHYEYMLHNHSNLSFPRDLEKNFHYLLLKEIEATNSDLLSLRALLDVHPTSKDTLRAFSGDFENASLKWQPNFKVLRARLAKAIRTARTPHPHAVARIFESTVPLSNRRLLSGLAWWGYAHDFGYWRRRERFAAQNKLPVASFSEKQVNEVALDVKGTQAPDGMIFKKMPPSNTPRNEEQPALFSVAKRNEYEKDVLFFALADPDLPGEVLSPVPFKEGHAVGTWSISLDTMEPIHPLGSRIAIPTPNLSPLVSLEVRDDAGKLLKFGVDYQILQTKNQTGYFIGFTHSDAKAIHFVAKFGAAEALPRKDVAELKIQTSRLKELTHALREGGLTAMVPALEGQIRLSETQGFQLTVADVARIFKGNALYSYHPEHSAALPGTRGIFAKYSRFVDENGRMCAQCDGTNSLFAEFMGILFSGVPSVKVDTQLGFANHANQFGLSQLHMQTEFNVHDLPVLYEDVTPKTHDPRSVRAAAAERPTARLENETSPVELYSNRLRSVRKAVAEAFRKTAGIDPAEPFAVLMKVSTIAEDFLHGRATYVETRTSLRSLLPSESHGYTTVQELLGFIASVGSRERMLLEKHFKATKNKRVSGAMYSRYYDPTKRQAIDELVDQIIRLPGDVASKNIL